MAKKLVRRWITASVDGFHIFLTVVLTGVWLAGWQLEADGVKAVAYYGIGIVAVLHILHWGLQSCRNFLELHEETDRLPVRQIKGVCGVFLGSMLFFLVFLIALIPHIDLTLLYRGLKSAVSWLAWLIGSLFSGDQSLEPMPEEAAPVQFSSPSWAAEAGEPSAFVKFLEAALQWAVWIVLTAFVFWLLHRIFARIRQYLSRVNWDTDEKVFLEPEIFSERTGKARRKKVRGLIWDRSYSGRIRRLYYKTLKEAAGRKREKLSPVLTPEELEKAAGVEFPKGGLHDLYEKARYSRDGAQKEDWERLLP